VDVAKSHKKSITNTVKTRENPKGEKPHRERERERERERASIMLMTITIVFYGFGCTWSLSRWKRSPIYKSHIK